jgi:hypothetical protein
MCLPPYSINSKANISGVVGKSRIVYANLAIDIVGLLARNSGAKILSRF